MKYKNIYLYMLIIFISSIPIFNDFLIRGHDIYFHLMRIEGLADGLRCGQFPVRIQPTWYGGFGYAVSVFYGDLFLYPVAILRLLGVSLQNSYKVYLFMCNIATTLIAGYSFNGIFKNKYIGLFGSAIYSFAVYRLVNLYTRGALGEYTGMMFLPLIVYACVLLLEKENLKKGTVLLGCGMSFILQSHILTTELVCIMLSIVVVFYLCRHWNKDVILSGIKAILIAIGISLGFLVPFLDYVLNGTYNINSNSREVALIQRMGIFLSQIFPLYDNAIGQSLDISFGTQEDFAQGVGLGLFFIVPVFFLVTLLNYKRVNKKCEWTIVLYTVFIGGLAVIFSTVYFPWDYLCKVNTFFKYIITNIQFPWRFTAIATVCFATAWCGVVKLIYRQYGKVICLLSALSVLVLMLLSLMHFYLDLFDRGQRIQVKQLQDMDSYVQSGEEYFPEGTIMENLHWDISMISDEIEITEFCKNGTELYFHCQNNSGKAIEVELPLLYYPGYKAIYVKENKENPVTLTVGENNVVSILIDGNMDSDIKVFYKEPWYWRVSEIVSVISILGIIVFCILC